MANKYKQFSKSDEVRRESFKRKRGLSSDAKGCFRKKRYLEDTALKLKKKIQQERGTELRVYYCPVCFGYHLTKTKLQQRKIN